ncbi:MAG: S8 family peptidase [Chitinophagaceae bacterium]
MMNICRMLTVFLATVLISPISLLAQGTSKKESNPKNWHLQDKAETGSYGISLDKAYQFVKGRNGKTIVVAVMDTGIDTTHEDLKNVLWNNPKEIPGNKIDDDKNGYVDDIHGWNFLGGKDGKNIEHDTDEGSRVYHRFKKKYESVTDESSLSPREKDEFTMFKKAKAKVEGGGPSIDVVFLRRIFNNAKKSDSLIRLALKKQIYIGSELETFKPVTAEERRAKSSLMPFYKQEGMMDKANTDFLEEFDLELSGEERKEAAKTKEPRDYRNEAVKDNEMDINDRFYGNNDLMGGALSHGTYCAGIIAAQRNNNKGMDGVADNVKIMMLRMLSDGDEHDKDIALAIRYAVDHGAHIISMSFGKDFSPEKRWVDEAVMYAESKGVLMIHAAGNDHENIDSTDNFPNPEYLNGKGRSSTFITVGASGNHDNGGPIGSFSNYGKNEVDIFAPGVSIYATTTGRNAYGSVSGTSMSAPVVAGTAAFLMSYFPELSAKQIKYAIEKSAVPLTAKVKKPGTDELVSFSELSKNPGLLNAYEAAKLASTLKPENKETKALVMPKPKMVVKKKRA